MTTPNAPGSSWRPLSTGSAEKDGVMPSESRTRPFTTALGRFISEASWQRTVLQAFKIFGWVVFHDRVAWRSDPGYPDITAVHVSRQRVIWVELKTEKGKLSAAQEVWRGVLESAGQEWFCWKPSDWDLIQRVMRGERL